MGSEKMGDHCFLEPPELGLKLRLDHEFPLQSKQIIRPSAQQAFELMPLTARYMKYYLGKRFSHKKPIMDYFHMVSAQRMYGCPIGGIGGGTIGRGFKGEFCRFQLYPGIYEYVTVPECQFIVNIRNEKNETIFQSVLSTYNKPKKAPSSWEWNLDPSKCEYTGLYPRAWTTYDLSQYGVRLVCRQISPVIPHNYKDERSRKQGAMALIGGGLCPAVNCYRLMMNVVEAILSQSKLPQDSSLPCAVFVFTAVNLTNEKRDVSIAFTWTEILGGSNRSKNSAKLDLERYSEDFTCGVTLEQKIHDTPCTFTIAKKKKENETIHEGYCLWNAAKTSSYIWNCLKEHGKLTPDASLTPPPPKLPDSKADAKQEKKEKPKKLYKYANSLKSKLVVLAHLVWCWLGAASLFALLFPPKEDNVRGDSVALSSVICMDPGGSGSTEFCLNWDMPVIKYKKDKKTHRRYYTKYFGSDGIAGASIAAYALRNYHNWEKLLAEWQDPIFTNNNIPDWLKSALMNELYFVADGGTIWFDVQDDFPETDPRNRFGVFGYLEGHEYRMYNTYDVHFYASFALAQLWPNLQVVLQYMYKDSIGLESEKSRTSLYDGKSVKYKIKDSIPHDLGDPEGIPFSHINAYNIHDVSEWKDLNLKFILQVFRDYRCLVAHSAPFGRRCESMQYIDDVKDGGERALTGRGPASRAETPAATPAHNNQPEEAPPQPVPGILELLYGATTEPSQEPEPAVIDSNTTMGVWDATEYLKEMYGHCVALLRRAALWDLDADGLIENSGFPDQTYDAWVMTGPGAYCGGLWVASISAVQSMAKLLGHEADEKDFASLLERAKSAYNDKLWTGSYYRFDTRPQNEHVVMADQLAGHWFLRASGCTDQVFPTFKVRKALDTVYHNNVLKWCHGSLGAVNGFVTAPAPRVCRNAIQSEEMWTGVTYGLAATMIYEGMHEEAFATAGGMYESLVKMGLSFETPEALYENGNHRSVGYMRPLAIWGMYQAIVSTPPQSRRPSQVKVNGQAKDL